MTLIVNLYGAPGSGKSTTASGVFHKLKINNVNAEYVTEVAKDFTWEKRHLTLQYQPYVFSKQFRDIYRLLDQVQVIVTDSPIFLGAFYLWKYPNTKVPYKSFVNYAYEQSKYIGGIDYFINRVKPYNPKGRNQTEDESNTLNDELKYFLQLYKINYKDLNGDETAVDIIYNEVMNKL